MEKRSWLLGSLMVVFVVAIVALPAVAAKPTATLWCTVNGESVTQVEVNQQFAVSGVGYKANVPVDVCIGPRECILANVDGDGEFHDVRTMHQAGTYTITVKQARNSRLRNWTVKATSAITVTD
jgi:hypothetical protein